MKAWIKIVLLVLFILPIWLTIAAVAETNTSNTSLDAWKERLNAKLLEVQGRKIQIQTLNAKATDFTAELESIPFEIDFTTARTQGMSEISIRFLTPEGQLSKLIRLQAKLFIQDLVPVAARTLNGGDLISGDDFKEEWRDVSTFRGTPVHANELTGRTIRSRVKENEVITDERLQRNQLISRGDRVRIKVVANGLIISGAGIAEEAGSKGQTIKVLNGDSRKEIWGVITEERVVEVRL